MEFEFKSHFDMAVDWAKIAGVQSKLTHAARAFIEGKKLGFMNLASKVTYPARVKFGEVEFNIAKITCEREPFIKMVVMDDSDEYDAALPKLRKMHEKASSTGDYTNIKEYKCDLEGWLLAYDELMFYGRGCFISTIDEGFFGPFAAVTLNVVPDIFCIMHVNEYKRAADSWSAQG
ncbi:hypothetical protein EVB87_091 [Rhizobium phage RHph_N28_1]|nr:hypothetical protein EVB87_091 [Rhizobium phage RHph_N28_1]QIG74119.1 hypothetical protein EVC07_091 [Rhizobium phage RHph_N42]QXV73778.1 hypothetical protein [Rhizobium phage RHph_N46]